jgi:hypothetical protein
MTQIKTNINQLKYGFLPGIIFPLIMFLLMYFVRYGEVGFGEYLKNLWRFQILMKLMTLCVLPNLVLFLFFFRRKQDMAARGVLMATFIYAFLLIISMALNA